jgi:hypothetical protein
VMRQLSQGSRNPAGQCRADESAYNHDAQTDERQSAFGIGEELFHSALRFVHRRNSPNVAFNDDRSGYIQDPSFGIGFLQRSARTVT